MKLVPDDDDSFEFAVSSDCFSKEEENMVFSNPLDDPDLHKKCKDKELCNKEECMVYIGGQELAVLNNTSIESYDDIIKEIEENI